MKKVFRKIQKGTTKMIERIKSLGNGDEAEMCSSTVRDYHSSTKNNDPIYSPQVYLRIFSYRRLDKGSFFVRHHAH